MIEAQPAQLRLRQGLDGDLVERAHLGGIQIHQAIAAVFRAATGLGIVGLAP